MPSRLHKAILAPCVALDQHTDALTHTFSSLNHDIYIQFLSEFMRVLLSRARRAGLVSDTSSPHMRMDSQDVHGLVVNGHAET